MAGKIPGHFRLKIKVPCSVAGGQELPERPGLAEKAAGPSQRKTE
jgi:hypothetical protein